MVLEVEFIIKACVLADVAIDNCNEVQKIEA